MPVGWLTGTFFLSVFIVSLTVLASQGYTVVRFGKPGKFHIPVIHNRQEKLSPMNKKKILELMVLRIAILLL